ncbi:MAG: DUF2279 domain-containing protein [Proteobacteria bacterium]|nr:DUF2279 domain-containing protein [Pseudomonadota bacterium]
MLSPALDESRSPRHPIAATLTLGGVYAGFTTWMYFAWYRKHRPLSEFKWGGDGLFESTEYAGGSDKLGHAWATLGLGRAGAETLRQWGGYDRWTSALIGAGLSELLFLGVEVKDGAYYEFSFGDAAFDTLGAILAVALTVSPRFDELFDFRVQYWPSPEYRTQFEGGNVNIAEDYSGEIYLAALHLGGIHALRDRVPLTRFIDVAAGFGTRGYKPDEPKGTCPPTCYEERQNLYFGVSLNAQGVFDYLFARRAPGLAKVTHAVFEMFNVPFTFVPAYAGGRTAAGMSDQGGA